MIGVELHKAQIQILRTLRYNPTRRYSELQKPTGLESDVFKFHVRKLVKHGYVYKSDQGLYSLTPLGKEFANNLSKVGKGIQKQPKLSVILIVKDRKPENSNLYLFQQRKRSPYYGFWGCISGPVQWGESFEDAAMREAKKQTGLDVHASIKGFIRKSDYDATDGNMLEDKLFVAMECYPIAGELRQDWPGGFCEWLTIDELAAKSHYFESTLEYINFVDSSEHYLYEEAAYEQSSY